PAQARALCLLRKRLQGGIQSRGILSGRALTLPREATAGSARESTARRRLRRARCRECTGDRAAVERGTGRAAHRRGRRQAVEEELCLRAAAGGLLEAD